MKTFNRMVDLLSVAVRAYVLALAAAIFGIVVFTVITRYAFNWVLSWSEEVPRYLLIWVTFLTAAIGVDLKDHIGFDYLRQRLSGIPRQVVELITNAGLAAFGFIMLFYGVAFVRDFGGDWMESIPYTNIWYYPAVPISGALVILYSVRDQLNVWFAPELRKHPLGFDEVE